MNPIQNTKKIVMASGYASWYLFITCVTVSVFLLTLLVLLVGIRL